MSYKDEEIVGPDVLVGDDETEILLVDDEVEDSMLDNELLGDDLILDDHEETEFVGLDGSSEY